MKKAEMFLFSVIFLSNFFMLFKLVKVTNSPEYKSGLSNYARMVTHK